MTSGRPHAIEELPCIWGTSSTGRGGCWQAARRCAHPRRRTDAGLAVRDAVAGPARRGGGEGRIGRRWRPAAAPPRRSIDPYGRTSARRSCATISTSVRSRSTSNTRGIEIVLGLAERFDVFAENFEGRSDARPRARFRRSPRPPIGCRLHLGVGVRQRGGVAVGWLPAYAPIVEAMSGIYAFKRAGDDPPVVAPVGALGDIGAALFAAWAFWRPFASGTAPARRSTSTSPCSTPWSR